MENNDHEYFNTCRVLFNYRLIKVGNTLDINRKVDKNVFFLFQAMDINGDGEVRFENGTNRFWRIFGKKLFLCKNFLATVLTGVGVIWKGFVHFHSATLTWFWFRLLLHICIFAL